MLELNRLVQPVTEMAEALAGQHNRSADLIAEARQRLEAHAQVSDLLREKLERAAVVDASWRGAEPLGERLDQRITLPQASPATLIASDGSQIYPDTHAVALYYLLNVAAIVLRQGSGQAPTIITKPQLFYRREELYGDNGEGLIDTDEVNYWRDLWELQVLAGLAVQERRQQGGDLEQALIALGDGPLLPWMPQRLSDTEQAQRVGQFITELNTLKSVQAIPLGYVDRPRSANVLRLLHLADLDFDQITKERLRRSNPYRYLADRSLFDDLKPGQRTGLFAATSEINRSYADRGQRIYFCYVNVATQRGAAHARIVRVEAPQWIAKDPTRMDEALAAVLADGLLMGYPYVLTRAHELALVSRHEKKALEQMLQTALMRAGMSFEESAKATSKRALGVR